MKGTVESITKTDFVDRNGNEYYNVTIDGVQGSYACRAESTPYFVVGSELEYEKTSKPDKNGVERFKFKKPKVPYTGGGGGGKAPYKPRVITQSITDTVRMVNSNAIHCLVAVNAAYGEERLHGKELAKIRAFTLGDITGDLEKFGEESSLLTSRLSSINNATIMAGYKSFQNADEIVAEATKLYNYITK